MFTQRFILLIVSRFPNLVQQHPSHSTSKGRTKTSHYTHNMPEVLCHTSGLSGLAWKPSSSTIIFVGEPISKYGFPYVKLCNKKASQEKRKKNTFS